MHDLISLIIHNSSIEMGTELNQPRPNTIIGEHTPLILSLTN